MGPFTRASIMAFCLLTFPLAGHAACYADYKAKQDDPLRLHYGVLALSDAACSTQTIAQQEAEVRLAQHGWVLLQVLSTFAEDGLATRKSDAGPYFLRF